MNNYIVPVEVVFSGKIKVRADNKMEARRIVLNNFSGAIETFMHNKNINIIDYNMQTFSKDIRFKRKITLEWPKR